MNALNPMAALQYKKHHTRKHRSQYPNMSCKRTKLVCIRKGFTQLFLVTALCIHRQVCQCYAGGGMNNGGSRGSPHSSNSSSSSSSNNNNNNSIGQHSLSPSTFHPLQPRAKFRKRNVNGRYDASGGGTAGSSKLYQSTAVTTIDDEGDDVQNRKGLSLRGGNDDASTEDKPIVKEEQQQHSIVEIENDDSASMAITNGEQQISIAQNFTTAVDDSTATMSSEEVDVITSEERKEPSIETTSTTTTTTPQVEQNAVVQKVETEQNSKWPCGDALDRQLIKIALPCIANFAINPLVGAVDLFWINRMGNTLAVAGQAAANQIFSSSFWLISFLPSVTATLVAKQHARGSEEGVQEAVSQALVLGTFVALFGMTFILVQPDRLLGGVLSADAPAREFAKPYLFIRGFAFLPSMLSLIGFSAFRGVIDTVTPLKISLFANLMNAILDPILIFQCKMGVTGAALATLAAEITSAVMFTTLLMKRKMILPAKIFRLPKWQNLIPLLQGGAALQLRNFALNITFLAVTRVTQSIDDTGVAAAAHAMAIQTFQIGGIVLLALSTVAQTVVPNAMIEKIDEKTGVKSGGIDAAKRIVSRLMRWGFVLGTVLGSFQVLLIPHLQKSTPIVAVREAARTPALLASLYQVINGLVFIGEGVMVGCGSFLQLSLSTLVATTGTVIGLSKFPKIYGLTGVWMSFGIFNTLRLIGVIIHQKVKGPLVPGNQPKIKQN